MVRFTGTTAIAAFVLAASVSAVTQPTSCDQNNKCPESQPCCSAYGQCGVGAYCLGGCDPRSSFSINACTPRPTCKSADFQMNTLDDVQQNTYYLGNPSNVNWVSEGTPVVYQDESILLTMAQGTVGTLLSSAHYVWYGKISATMKTSIGQGVVTAFVMMSDVKDEIDYEFVGADVQHAQSNFYWQGVLNYTNAANLSAPNTATDWHTYTVDWQPDSLTWAVDGQVLRTLTRDSTFNSTTNTYQYPQTPSRIQLSLWPAGSPSNAEGVIDWAGGLINWNSQYMANGYYYAQIKEINVECYDPPSDAVSNGDVSYVYSGYTGLENSVSITNDNTTLASFYASGLNPNENPNSQASGTASGSLPTASLQTVPGIVGSGSRGSQTDGSDGDGSGSGSGSGSNTGPGTFIQGDNTSSGKSNAAPAVQTERALQNSAFAVLVAIFALMVL